MDTEAPIESNGKVTQDDTRKGWVKFDDETSNKLPANTPEESSSPPIPSSSTPTLPAVLSTETVQLNIERSERVNEPDQLFKKNVEFISVRQGFCKLPNIIIYDIHY